MSKPKPAVPIIYRHREQRRRERLRGFNPGVRDAIAELTCCSQEAEDLADSFPGLLYALVTGFGTPSAREACFNHVLEGKSLRLAAAALGLPYWTRRLPPQAFSEPLCNLPSSADFDSRISHLIPSSRILVRPWLDRILCAYHVCGEEFAIWVGRNLRLPLPEATDESFTFLTAWAWHSITLEAPGHALLNRPWTSKMSLRRAEEEVVKWRRRLSLSYSLGNGLPNAWLNAGVVGEFEFVPLLTAQDFIRESEAMDNCLDQYSDRMASGGIRVFSIRREGVPVADIELGPIARQSHLPTIVQIKAARNRPAPLAVWRAAHAWLKGHGDVPLPRRPGALKIGERRQAMRRIWVPYFAHLPERMLPSLAALLAREPLVRQSSRRLLPSDSWLFPDRFLPIGTDPVFPAPATAFTDDGDVSGTS